jgi:transcriptional repressor NrdR
VLDSRETEDQTRRRRECAKCEKRFTTYEKVENINLTVIKKDGRKESFNRDKLKRGIFIAGSKRIPEDKMNEIIDDIENRLKEYESNEIPSKKIGEEVMTALKKNDKIAYIRFASVYKDFEDLDEVKEEIEKILKKKGV